MTNVSKIRWAAVSALIALMSVACSSSDSAEGEDAGAGGSGGSGGVNVDAAPDAVDETTPDAQDETTPDATSEETPDATTDGGNDCLTCVAANCQAEYGACAAIQACNDAIPAALACAQDATKTQAECATDFVLAASANDDGGTAGADAANTILTCLLGGDAGPGCVTECGIAAQP